MNITFNISSAKYYQGEEVDSNGNLVSTGENVGIVATIDGVVKSIPLDPQNPHYAEILKQVADGNLTIADAD